VKEWIALAGMLALTVAVALALAGRIKSEPKTAPRPSDSAVSSVILTFNEEADKYWRRIGGDLANGYINLGDYHDYRNGNAGPVDKPLLATMEIRAQDTDGFLFTADISAGNYRTRRATPFAESRNGHICLDFKNSGDVLTRKRGLATYDC
jgi:hypothetical protein